MRRPAIAALLTAWFLVVTAGAEAKEPPAGFQLCGSNGCASIGMDDGEPLAARAVLLAALVLPAGPVAHCIFRSRPEPGPLRRRLCIRNGRSARRHSLASARLASAGDTRPDRDDAQADTCAFTFDGDGRRQSRAGSSELSAPLVSRQTYVQVAARRLPQDQGHLRRREPVDRRVRASQYRAPRPIPVAGLDRPADPGEARTARPRARLAPLAASPDPFEVFDALVRRSRSAPTNALRGPFH